MKASGIQVGNKFTLQPYNHVLQDQPPFFQPANTQLIDHRVVRKAVYQVIKISVADAQFTEARKLLKGLGIYFLTHQCRALTPVVIRNPTPAF